MSRINSINTANTVSSSLAALVACVLVLGCSAVGPAGGPVAPNPPRSTTTIADVPMTVEAAEGELQIRVRGGDWTGIQLGAVPRGTTHLRANGSARLSLGSGDEPTGRLWLRAGAEVVLAGRDGVDLEVSMTAGEARLSGFDTDLTLSALGPVGPIMATGRDLLMARDAGLSVVETSADLAGARWSLEIGDAREAAGVGTLEARSPRGTRAALTLAALKVDGVTRGEMVETRIEHIFRNDSDEQLEGTFRFPLPSGAILTGLAMDIDGKLMEGELVEREKARETYQGIVDSMRDPALLEWVGGSTFKLRVFPIGAQSTKRIVLRCLLPITRGARGARLAYATAAPAMQERIGHFRLVLDGRVVVDERAFAPGPEIVASIAPSKLSTGPQSEVVANATWTSVRIAPSIAGSTRRSRRDVIAIVDTSRSTLESRALQLEVLESVLSRLREGDRFIVSASDITVRDHASDFVSASPAAVEQALAFVRGISPDGASDVLAALKHAGALTDRAGLVPVQVVYIGDGAATWGETDPQSLREGALMALEQTPLHAVALGKSSDQALLSTLAGLTGGRSVSPRTSTEVRAFGLFLAAAAGAPRLRNALVTTRGAAEVHPRIPRTLFAGDAIEALIRADTTPESVTLTGSLDGRPFELTRGLSEPGYSRGIAARWGDSEIRRLQDEGAEKDEIVALSRATGVMSKYTSFLVLESEEAYRQAGIKRLRGPNGPQVTGRDLESVGGPDGPSLHPDHIQPGDPEIRVPAPRDARSVVVVFPFGESMPALWDDSIGVWSVRFLIDKETPDGEYPVVIRITHRDGRPELLRLSYTVDTKAPTVTLTMTASSEVAGTYELVAEQVLENLGDGVVVSPDLSRVEARMPDGRVIRLRRVGVGHFAGVWKPRQPVSGAIQVRLVAVDIPGNNRVFELTLDVGGQP
ncbi:MAG: hypothetical protein ACI9WU_003012 [Myxococcota bacterium]|jgi:hypothetical protein